MLPLLGIASGSAIIGLFRPIWKWAAKSSAGYKNVIGALLLIKLRLTNFIGFIEC